MKETESEPIFMTPKALLHLLENQKGKTILCYPFASPSASQKSYFLLPVPSSWGTRQPTASTSASQSIQSCLGPSSFHLPASLSFDSLSFILTSPTIQLENDHYF